MAAANLIAVPCPSAHPMARPGYGKREAPEQLPRDAGDFEHLPEREAYLAGFVDRLPEGAAIDYKTLANAQPRYGRQAARSALDALSRAGHLRRIRENAGHDGQVRHVTRTYFSRTARDDAWWAAFLAGDVPPERAEAPRTRARRSEAYEALAALGTADPRMGLSAAECEALEGLAAEWLARGVTAAALVRALTTGLPGVVHSPGAFARRRLTGKMPPEPAVAARPSRQGMECTHCGRPGRPEALPGGLCRDCRGDTVPGAPSATTDLRARVAELRSASRRPVGARR